MQKLALAALIAASIPMMAVAETAEVETISNEEVVKQDKEGELVFVAPVDLPAEFASAEKSIDVAPVQVGADGVESTLTLEQITKHIQDNNFDIVSAHIDFKKMHAAYLTQMNYINGKVNSLSEFVAGVAAGTFETRIREGSMLLGLISESVNKMVEHAAQNEDKFQEFIKIKFQELSVVELAFDIEEDDGVYLISVKRPNADSADIITAFKMPDGSFKLVSYMPSEVEDINNIINTLYATASASEQIDDELERRALTETAIDADAHRASSPIPTNIDSVIEQVQPEAISEFNPEAPAK